MKISESSNEEPFSPPVSEYLPSSSPSPIADLGNTLPSSILNDFDFSLRDCLASPTVVFISNPQKTISMGNKDSYENLAVSSGNYIEGVNPLPNDADLEPVSTFWYNAPLPEKSITAAEPETEPTFTSPTRTLLTLESTTVMLREAEPASIACRDEFPLVEHNTAAEPEKELTSTSLAKTPQTLENTPAILPEAEPTSITCYNDETLPVGHNTLTEPETEPISTSPDRTPPVSSIATAIVPHSDPPIIACHVETLPAGYNSTTEPEATNSRPVLVTEANTNPRKRKRNPEKWSQTQKKIKLNTGQQPQKQMQEPCKCKLKCFEKIPSDRRLVIFKQFWACGNHETQWQFILKNTEIIEPKVMKIQQIKTSPDAPNKLLFKYDFESEYLVLDTTNRTTTTRTRKSNNANAVDVNELPLAYAQLLPISDALFKDLISLCNTNAIPLHYQTFYRNLLPVTESPNLELP
ncbi:hypothetical protein HW555_011351 [Spodoptera exigua]|uniref:Uncharacterized protein n=1 Tax=Spodoptera exigua TaxID=7107 RepID=A0A835G8Q1_SPOEX|nr:hypothetical protein HW555_011351 [Spodoptera exigua]